jgi:hypothetical protein
LRSKVICAAPAFGFNPIVTHDCSAQVRSTSVWCALYSTVFCDNGTAAVQQRALAMHDCIRCLRAGLASSKRLHCCTQQRWTTIPHPCLRLPTGQQHC